MIKNKQSNYLICGLITNFVVFRS